MSLYFAPAFFSHLLGKCLKRKYPIIEVTKLAFVVLGTFALVWWPFLHSHEAALQVMINYTLLLLYAQGNHFKGRTQCRELPLCAGSGEGCQWQALPSPVQCEETVTRTRDLPVTGGKTLPLAPGPPFKETILYCWIISIQPVEFCFQLSGAIPHHETCFILFHRLTTLLLSWYWTCEVCNIRWSLD